MDCYAATLCVWLVILLSPPLVFAQALHDHKANHTDTAADPEKYPSLPKPGEKIHLGADHYLTIVRALVNAPEILLADEPTGNLDTRGAQKIGEILRELNVSRGLTILLVTHNQAMVSLAHRVVEMRDGRLVSRRFRGQVKFPRDALFCSHSDNV